MFNNPLLNKDPAGAKMPLGQRLLKTAFTSCVSAVAGVQADSIWHKTDEMFKKKTEPTVPPTE